MPANSNLANLSDGALHAHLRRLREERALCPHERRPLYDTRIAVGEREVLRRMATAQEDPRRNHILMADGVPAPAPAPAPPRPAGRPRVLRESAGETYQGRVTEENLHEYAVVRGVFESDLPGADYLYSEVTPYAEWGDEELFDREDLAGIIHRLRRDRESAYQYINGIRSFAEQHAGLDRPEVTGTLRARRVARYLKRCQLIIYQYFKKVESLDTAIEAMCQRIERGEYAPARNALVEPYNSEETAAIIAELPEEVSGSQDDVLDRAHRHITNESNRIRRMRSERTAVTQSSKASKLRWRYFKALFRADVPWSEQYGLHGLRYDFIDQSQKELNKIRSITGTLNTDAYHPTTRVHVERLIKECQFYDRIGEEHQFRERLGMTRMEFRARNDGHPPSLGVDEHCGSSSCAPCDRIFGRLERDRDFGRQLRPRGPEVIRTHECYSYNHRPRWEFLDKAKDGKTVLPRGAQCFFGIELEINCPRDRRTELMDLAVKHMKPNTFLWKEDGSIQPGMELVLAPMNYDGFRKCGLRAFCKEAKEAGFRSYKSGQCGLHIHYSSPHYNEFRSQVTRNLKAFLLSSRRQVIAFSGRQLEKMSYCWMPGAGTRDELLLKKKHRDHLGNVNDGHWQNRYSAINFNPSNTVEFRVFRGTLHYRRILASIQFVESVMQYCAADSAMTGFCRASGVRASVYSDSCWESFCFYVDSRPQFHALSKYLRSKRIWGKLPEKMAKRKPPSRKEQRALDARHY